MQKNHDVPDVHHQAEQAVKFTRPFSELQNPGHDAVRRRWPGQKGRS